MNKTRLFKKSIIAVTIALASQQAVAAGFQLNAQSATGLGRAFAGDAVIADNAASMARNPATMALFDETALSLGFVSITSKIKVKDATYTNPVTAPSGTPSNYGDAGDTSIAPNIHLIVPVNEKFAWGINAYTNFGTKTEFDDSFAAAEYGGLTDIKSFNLGLAGSYRLDESWSFGAGIDFIYGRGKLQRDITFLNNTADPSQGVSKHKALDIDADGWAVGFNLGTVYELDENNRFGLAYHYSPELEAEGDITKVTVDPNTGNLISPTNANDTLYMPLPDIVEFSGFHKIKDTKFAVHYSVQWIGWSSFDILDSKDTGKIKDYEWQNGMHYSIGGTYYLNQDWTLRAGYMHDTSAQDKITSISVPDSDRNWFSTGFTYHLDQKANIDFGFTYLVGDDVKVSESNALGTSISATTHADAILMGLQYSRTF